MTSMNSSVNLGDVIFTFIFIGLILIAVLSFTLFIRTFLKNQQSSIQNSQNIEQKLDRIITLLESEKEENIH